MYKTILVHVDETKHCAQRIALASRLALQYEGHLVGAAMTGISAYMFPNPLLEPGAPPIIFPLEQLRAGASKALDRFDLQVGQSGVHSFERRLIEDDAGAGLSLHARYADLVVISRVGADEFAPRLRSDFGAYMVLNCPRPVLVLPPGGVGDNFGKRVAVAWNGSENAVRAIASAIPLLRRAEEVSVLVMTDGIGGEHGDEPGADIAAFLARHGIRVTVTVAHPRADYGEALLSLAQDKAADLIVMGAYGRSRFSEFLLGGVSRTVLESSPLPVWMAH